MRVNDASLDADRHQLADDSRARMPQKEDTRAVPGPRQCRHTILVHRCERPTVAHWDVTYDYLALIGPSGYPTAVARESHTVQSHGQCRFLPAFQITCSCVLHEP